MENADTKRLKAHTRQLRADVDIMRAAPRRSSGENSTPEAADHAVLVDTKIRPAAGSAIGALRERRSHRTPADAASAVEALT